MHYIFMALFTFIAIWALALNLPTLSAIIMAYVAIETLFNGDK